MPGEGPDARLGGMSDTTRGRQRPTDTMREAARLADAVAASLGRSVRTGRKRRGFTQAELGQRVGVKQAWISRIELGHGRAVPLHLWVAIGAVLGQPLAVSFTRPLSETRAPADVGHLVIQEHLLGLARATGRTATFELPTHPVDPSRSIDVCVRDSRHRTLIIEEAWNTFGDLGAAIRSTHRKEAEAADLAATIDDGPPYRVATVWILNATAANRALVGRFPEIFMNGFEGSSRRWVSALTAGASPPSRRGLVWFDPATRRIHEWRLALGSTDVSSSGRSGSAA